MAHDRRVLEDALDRVELRGECRTSRFGWNSAGTPALELAGFEFHDAASQRCPPALPATSKLEDLRDLICDASRLQARRIDRAILRIFLMLRSLRGHLGANDFGQSPFWQATDTTSSHLDDFLRSIVGAEKKSPLKVARGQISATPMVVK